MVGVTALAQTDEGDVFTGCVNEASGVLGNVAVGLDPAKPCNPQESQITWDRAGPAFEERIAALEEQVAELEEPYGTLELTVDCAAGGTVGAALAEAQTHPGPVNITISGVCEENVGINRDDVSLSGLVRSDGIRAASAASTVHVNEARNVRFENMTISGGTAGIEAWGSSFTADHVTVRDTTIWGIWGTGSTLGINNSSIVDNSGFGVTARGGFISIRSSSLSGNGTGLNSEDGGTIEGFDLTVTSNRVGVVAIRGGGLSLSGSSIEDNTDWGVAEWHAGSVRVGGDSRIANNGKTGVLVAFNSVFNVGGTVIENNGYEGINANGSSTVEVGADVMIRYNASGGITLRDSSYGSGVNGQAQIIDNGGWGINCAGPATVKEAQNGFNMSSIVFSGNTDGDTNCP